MAIRVGEGRWALSRIVLDVGGPLSVESGFTTAASAQQLSPTVHNFYPPLNEAGTGYSLPFALVRLIGPVGTPDANTRLIPAMLVDATLRDLTAQQRQRLSSEIEEWFGGYQFRDYDGTTKVRQAFSAAGYTLDTPLRRILLDLFEHMGHSESRPRAAIPESHNTEYLDDFATDPYSAPRWTQRLQTAPWDGTNLEVDVFHVGNPTLIEYTANTPGSIEHEAQVTALSAAGETRFIGAAVRVDGGAANDFYAIDGDNSTDVIRFVRRQGGSLTTLTTTALSYMNDFLTLRIAASGGAGATVELAGWFTNHGASKPSDPGWIGVDGSPDFTYSDTAASRLDDSTHDACGIGGASAVSNDYDTRHDFWKSRAISDRGGAPAGIIPPRGLMLMGVGR